MVYSLFVLLHFLKAPEIHSGAADSRRRHVVALCMRKDAEQRDDKVNGQERNHVVMRLASSGLSERLGSHVDIRRDRCRRELLQGSCPSPYISRWRVRGIVSAVALRHM